VLKTLFEHQGRCPIGQIAREHHLTNATVSGLINRLEAMQPPLVVRERSEADRRSITVIMTAAGEERFFAIQHDILEQAKIILRLLSKEERQDILEKISRYYKIVLELFPVDTTAPGKGFD
jgi:DNA-binding MarR family transcriptional regulator